MKSFHLIDFKEANDYDLGSERGKARAEDKWKGLLLLLESRNGFFSWTLGMSIDMFSGVWGFRDGAGTEMVLWYPWKLEHTTLARVPA